MATPPDPRTAKQMHDRWSTVPRLLRTSRYCVIATADEHGEPWATPVFFAAAGDRHLFWVSGVHSRHSRNIAVRPRIAVTVFDSTVPVGGAEALYLTADAGVCADPDRARAVLNAALPTTHQLVLTDLVPAGPLTAYEATVTRHEVLVRGGDPEIGNVIDRRHEVHPPTDHGGSDHVGR